MNITICRRKEGGRGKDEEEDGYDEGGGGEAKGEGGKNENRKPIEWMN